MKKFGLILFGFLVIFIIGPLLNGLVLANYWDWFILPVFKNVPSITYSNAIGIMFIWNFLTYTIAKTKDKELEELEATGRLLKIWKEVNIRTIASLLIGFVYKVIIYGW